MTPAEQGIAAAIRDDQVRMNTANIREIFRKIAAGERKHGGFLTTYAKAVMHADEDNFVIMLTACHRLIEKYQLHSYAEATDAR